MTNNTTNFPSFASSSSPFSNPIPFHPFKKQRKKRTKLIKIEPNLIPSSDTNHSKPKKYNKKPDPSAPKITRPCTECGKKFWSWKALFGHMRCHPERQWRGINPPPNYRTTISPIQEESTVMSAEDHEVASCLLFLSNSGDIGNCNNFVGGEDCNLSGFECSSCKKVFESHQALVGHRASHKNVKGCFAITKNRSSDGDDHGNCEIVENVADNNNNNNVLGHKCNICLRVFSSRQALGDHKSCHWDQRGDFVCEGKEKCGFDLNLTAPLDDYYYSQGFNLDLRLGL